MVELKPKVYRVHAINTYLKTDGGIYNYEQWYKFNITFGEYKQSLARHLGNLDKSKYGNRDKRIIKERIRNATNLQGIYDAFNGTDITIRIKSSATYKEEN